MVEATIKNFDLKQIAESGQIFRMKETTFGTTPGYFIGSGSRSLFARQEDGQTFFYCTGEEMKEYWFEFFDLDLDYEFIAKSIDPEDFYLKHAAAAGEGIRILKQDLFEVCISFLISQNNNIPRIKKTIYYLCEHYGREEINAETGIRFYTFPTPEALARLDDTELKAAGLGYRARYISEFAKNVENERINFFDLENYYAPDLTHRYLTAILGIGDKVANCIQLFGLHQLTVFPIDTWINKIIDTYYGGRFPIEKYGLYAGVIQQYLFNYAVNRKEV